MEETEKERAERLKQWENFLEDEEEGERGRQGVEGERSMDTSGDAANRTERKVNIVWDVCVFIFSA